MKYEVTLVLPKNRKILEDAYTKVMVDIATEMLNADELKILINRLKKKLNEEQA